MKKSFSVLKNPSPNVIKLISASLDFIKEKCISDSQFASQYESYILNHTNLKKGDIKND